VATFLALAFAFPTVVFTTLLMIFMGYWVLVLVGALGFDLSADGALEAKSGAIEGAMGAKTGAIEAGLEAKFSLLGALGFGTVPGSVVLTTLTFWAWSLSMLGSAYLGPALGGFLPAWLVGGAVGSLALLLGGILAGICAKPLRPIFTLRVAPTRSQLLGKMATVATSRVDGTGRMGQANLEDGEAGFLLSVFCSKENALKKGDRVLLLEYDEAKDAYEVEPVDWLLPEEVSRLDNPLAAEAIARAHLKQRIES
jgi:hypothetical protein